MTMADEKTARYVAYIDSLITVSPKSQSAISREIGYKNPNILSLIKKGRIPLPVEKVLPLAEALNADPVRLMMMVLEDRQPELTAERVEKWVKQIREELHLDDILNA